MEANPVENYEGRSSTKTMKLSGDTQYTLEHLLATSNLLNSGALVRRPLVGEVSANFSG
jgi:hypothetical protein